MLVFLCIVLNQRYLGLSCGLLPLTYVSTVCLRSLISGILIMCHKYVLCAWVTRFMIDLLVFIIPSVSEPRILVRIMRLNSASM